MLTFDQEACRRLLEERGLSIRAVARALRTPPTTVSGWLNARHDPSRESLRRLAELLSVPVEALLRETDDFTPGVRGAVALPERQALLLAVAVALAQGDVAAITGDMLKALKPAEREELLERLVVTPQWAAAWQRLMKLGATSHPLDGYGLQVRIVPPARRRA